MPRGGCSALHGVNPNKKKKELTAGASSSDAGIHKKS